MEKVGWIMIMGEGWMSCPLAVDILFEHDNRGESPGVFLCPIGIKQVRSTTRTNTCNLYILILETRLLKLPPS